MTGNRKKGEKKKQIGSHGSGVLSASNGSHLLTEAKDHLGDPRSDLEDATPACYQGF